jgi:hypothetical protein
LWAVIDASAAFCSLEPEGLQLTSTKAAAAREEENEDLFMAGPKASC